MKLRWWVVGAIAAVAGGILVMKHIAENKDKSLFVTDDDNAPNYKEFSADINESEFEGIDFFG